MCYYFPLVDRAYYKAMYLLVSSNPKSSHKLRNVKGLGSEGSCLTAPLMDPTFCQTLLIPYRIINILRTHLNVFLGSRACMRIQVESRPVTYIGPYAKKVLRTHHRLITSGLPYINICILFYIRPSG